MGNSAIIELAIGLIFVYSLLSILVTQINTIIGNALNLRAKGLKDGLTGLLTDPVVRARIMTHPLIGVVSDRTPPNERITSQKAEEICAAKPTDVSYIPPQTFVDVLTDVLTGDRGQKLYVGLTQAIDALPASTVKSEIRELVRKIQISGTGLQELRDAIIKLEDAEQQKTLLEALNLVEDALDALGVESSDLIPLLVGVRQIQEPYLQKALEAVLQTANSLNDAQLKIAQWFDNSMNRVSDLFKREMHRISLIIGFALAVILNVDTVHLGRTLWEDPALRQAVAVTAQANARESVEQTPSETVPDLSAQSTEDLITSASEAQGTLEDLLNLRLPVGWEFTPVNAEIVQASLDSEVLPDPYTNTRNLWNLIPGNSPHWFSLVIQKIIGLIITTIAVAQGAPFWFDLLNKLASRTKEATLKIPVASE
jgi:hypothetical protein